MTASFTLSAFGDEIADDVDEQLKVLNDLEIGYLELRSAWGTNVLELSDDEVARLIELCDIHSVRVSCIDSPIGKSPIDRPIGDVVADLKRILDIAKMLGTDRVRVFSFYPEVEGDQAARVEESISRLRVMAEVAGERGVVLMLENEGGLVGDTPERCRALVEGVAVRTCGMCGIPGTIRRWVSHDLLRLGGRYWPSIRSACRSRTGGFRTA